MNRVFGAGGNSALEYLMAPRAREHANAVAHAERVRQALHAVHGL